jgi:hypothetical protein
MYERLIYVPLNLPPLDFDREEFLTWFDQKKARGMEEYVASIGYPWNVVWLLSPEHQPELLLDTPIRNLLLALKALPHRTIRRVYLLEQLVEVPHHADISREDDPSLGPSTYRNMMINDAPESTFYYLRGNRSEGTVEPEPIFPRLPEGTRWFAHNNYKSRHGSFMPPEGARKVIFCVWGEVDPLQHNVLLQQSVLQYPEYVIG